MIEIKKNNKCDTRTCNVYEVNKEKLLSNTKLHIEDVSKGMNMLATEMQLRALNHDYTKLIDIDGFYKDFQTGFETIDWWTKHQKEERHHFNNQEYIQEDVNLIDIIEQIVDGVMAGMARSGRYRQENISPELLLKAYNNTVKLLLSNVRVVE